MADQAMDSASTSDGYTMQTVSTTISSEHSIGSYVSSRDGQNLLREIEGRTLNAQNELYMLPADEGEHDRLDKQHIVHLLSIGGLYLPVEEVAKVLDPATGGHKAILDLGCGSGTWATSMAMNFPHAEVVGTDLAPSTTRSPPANCRYEFDDFTLGLTHYYDYFDVVHARTVAAGVKDYPAFITEAAKCLKPGGILILVDGNLEAQNEYKEPQTLAFGEGAPGESWFARACNEAQTLWMDRGASVNAGAMFEEWVPACPELVDVNCQTVWVPVGPWETCEDPEKTVERHRLGICMRQDMKEYAKSLKPLLISAGYPAELVDRFETGTAEELDELSVHMYIRYHHAWGRRKSPDSDESTPAVQTPGHSSAMDVDGPLEGSSNTPSTLGSGPSTATPRRFASPGPNATPVIFRDPETVPEDERTLSDIVSMSISSASRKSRRF